MSEFLFNGANEFVVMDGTTSSATAMTSSFNINRLILGARQDSAGTGQTTVQIVSG